MENEKGRLIAQLQNYKTRCRSAVDSSMEKNRHDEQIITVRFKKKNAPKINERNCKIVKL